ncbi:uncharacterized protein PHACADRAFT_108397 [Phanerochaete carnosa HHB-10118-sp]|uniref:Uncharacterized protein n=1 Tax=Phanerochaete carnosa (strain HHB-10118-sp) TaxID=650164 RepID=K5UGW6_PHACS|nr:uncharacterized protein PHACADRAFT_108397 [Phanerochaete carnosa HHB-10118-sp]EKM48726.1 hypothetical protein PHACADRAFT_108397 [Phanerochaete carnosa HHB-10118-sp]
MPQTTERVSKSTTPLLHEVIPLVDVLTTGFKTAATDISLLKPVQVAAACDVQMLNRYYRKTDDLVMYHIAMSMTACYISTITANASWPSDWIEEAKHIFCK